MKLLIRREDLEIKFYLSRLFHLRCKRKALKHLTTNVTPPPVRLPYFNPYQGIKKASDNSVAPPSVVFISRVPAPIVNVVKARGTYKSCISNPPATPIAPNIAPFLRVGFIICFIISRLTFDVWILCKQMFSVLFFRAGNKRGQKTYTGLNT